MSSSFSTYQFATKHSPTWHFQQRCRSRDRRMGYAGYPIRVDQIGNRDNLYECYRHLLRNGGPGAGADGIRPSDLSPSEAGELVGSLSERILAGTYRPTPTLPVAIPKPGQTEFRTLNIPVVGDRIVGLAVHRAFAEMWEQIFLGCSYGFRRGRSTWRMLAALTAAMNHESRWVLAIDDIRQAFDNLPINSIVELHDKYIGKVQQLNFDSYEQMRTVRLIDVLLRGYDQEIKIGIPQGGPYSPTALNVLLHDILDLPFMERVDNEPLWFRYADNVAYLARGVNDGRQALRAVSTLLQPYGLSLKGTGGCVVDLSRRGEAHLLGFVLAKERDEIRFKIGADAWNSLRQSLGAAHAQGNPPQKAREAVLGWIDSLGPAFESGEASQVLSIAAEYGFREISETDIQQRWKISWKRWRRCVRRSNARCQG